MNISLVVLNWQRPAWLRWVILPYLTRHPLIDEVIVSHGRQDTAFSYRTRHCAVVHREDWGLNDEFGLSLRFVAAEGARNEAVLLMDDDLAPSHRTVTFLSERGAEAPLTLHGIQGRGVTSDYEYRYGGFARGPTPIVLTRCVLMDRSYGALFLKEAHRVAHLIGRGVPKWNGEDIFLSLLSILRTGALPQVYDLDFKNVWRMKRGSIKETQVPADSSVLLPHEEYRRWFTKEAIGVLGLGATIDALLLDTRSP